MKRLLLLGAGHAHLHVLAALARQRLVDVEVTLVEPNSHAVYSGMVPGVVAGHYAVSDCHIDWPPLLQAAAASGRLATATALDSAAQRVQLSDGGSLSYDLLSIDTGAVIERPDIPGADELAWPVRPMVDFLQRLELLRVQTERAAIDIVVIGGGAAGIELAMALQRRLQHSPRPGRTALVAGDGSLLAGHASGVRRLALAALRRWRISVIPEDCVAIEPGQMRLRSGARLACDIAVLATGAQAPRWLKGSGLALDDQGFIRTGPTLQSVNRPDVFAAGDVAARDDEPRPRSGVQAVRAGPTLAHNLLAMLTGTALRSHRPPTTPLYLLSCGDRRAIASWGSWSAEGSWPWRWKDLIDRRFVDRFNRINGTPLPPTAVATSADPLNPRA